MFYELQGYDLAHAGNGMSNGRLTEYRVIYIGEVLRQEYQIRWIFTK